MSKAIKKAWKYQLLTYPNPAVGAVIVKNGKAVATKAHKKAGDSHAELLAIKKAYAVLSGDMAINSIKSPQQIYDYVAKHHDNIFHNCQIYTTLEPCSHEGKTPSCATMITLLKFQKVYIGSIDTNPTASGGAAVLRKAGIEVVSGVLKDNCDKLLSPFLSWQKDSGRFCFFKLAMRTDGSITDGQISSAKTSEIVHRLRTLIDLLVIGGKTVRSDRPILDTRKYKKSERNPDVMIYSNQTNFDKTIKLFHIKDREVHISDSLNFGAKNKFIMIEGGFDMLEATRPNIDMLVLIVANSMPLSSEYKKFMSRYTLLYKADIGQDSIYYLL